MENKGTRKIQLSANKKVPMKKISFLALISNNAVGPSRKLLQKHGKDATNIKNAAELEARLADLYSTSTDKMAIEKEFAEIHPHKHIILKHLAPAAPSAEAVAKMVKDQVGENKSGCDGGNCKCGGNCGCNSKKSNACGCSQSSSFDANPTQNNTYGVRVNTELVVIGTVSLVAIFGITALLLKRQ